MARMIPEEVVFDRDDLSELVGKVQGILDEASGGWVNLRPDLEEDVVAALSQSPVGRLFSARGPVIPMATVMAPDRRKRRGSSGSIGLEHHGGPKAVDSLARAEIAVPSGLVKRQDHSKRGLVYEFDRSVVADDLVSFLIDAAQALSAIDLGQRWIAACHRSL